MSLTIHAHHLGHIYSLFPQKRVQKPGSQEIGLGHEKRPQFPGAVWKGIQQISLLPTRLISFTFLEESVN